MSGLTTVATHPHPSCLAARCASDSGLFRYVPESLELLVDLSNGFLPLPEESLNRFSPLLLVLLECLKRLIYWIGH
jgi:hypothetical protein